MHAIIFVTIVCIMLHVTSARNCPIKLIRYTRIVEMSKLYMLTLLGEIDSKTEAIQSDKVKRGIIRFKADL
jgi:hypothetical protein